MDRPKSDRGASLRGYPNLSAAARMLGVATSTLSRRNDLRSEGRGERDLVLPAAEVLRLAAIYRKRALNDVAEELIELARASSEEEGARVEEEVEGFFEARELGAKEVGDFLEAARRLLPADLSAAVEETLREGDTEERGPDVVVGYHDGVANG